MRAAAADGAGRRLSTSRGRPARCRPASTSPLGAPRPPQPLLVYFHGGGWVIGDLDTHDALCRFLARTPAARAVGRLPPRARAPLPGRGRRRAARLRRAAPHADELGADPARIAVGGDSAGGNLAAVVCQLAARRRGPQPAFQLLIYPVTDTGGDRALARELFAEGFLLTRARWTGSRTSTCPTARRATTRGLAAARRGPLRPAAGLRRDRRLRPAARRGRGLRGAAARGRRAVALRRSRA